VVDPTNRNWPTALHRTLSQSLRLSIGLSPEQSAVVIELDEVLMAWKRCVSRARTVTVCVGETLSGVRRERRRSRWADFITVISASPDPSRFTRRLRRRPRGCWRYCSYSRCPSVLFQQSSPEAAEAGRRGSRIGTPVVRQFLRLADAVFDQDRIVDVAPFAARAAGSVAVTIVTPRPSPMWQRCWRRSVAAVRHLEPFQAVSVIGVLGLPISRWPIVKEATDLAGLNFSISVW